MITTTPMTPICQRRACHNNAMRLRGAATPLPMSRASSSGWICNPGNRVRTGNKTRAIRITMEVVSLTRRPSLPGLPGGEALQASVGTAKRYGAANGKGCSPYRW